MVIGGSLFVISEGGVSGLSPWERFEQGLSGILKVQSKLAGTFEIFPEFFNFRKKVFSEC